MLFQEYSKFCDRSLNSKVVSMIVVDQPIGVIIVLLVNWKFLMDIVSVFIYCPDQEVYVYVDFMARTIYDISLEV